MTVVRSCRYQVGAILESGSVVLERLGRLYATSRHYRFRMRCKCGAEFESKTSRMSRGCVCDACAQTELPIVTQRQYGSCQLVGFTRDKVPLAELVCGCGEPFRTKSWRLSIPERLACGKCRAARRRAALPCEQCGNMPWRVKSSVCRECGTVAGDEVIEIDIALRSSAGMIGMVLP